jgi:hypothetical protein
VASFSFISSLVSTINQLTIGAFIGRQKLITLFPAYKASRQTVLNPFVGRRV